MQNIQTYYILWSVAEFEMMTSDEMIIHIFAETDNMMSRLVLEILAGLLSSVSELRNKVTETKN